jgi:hypothetical protein
MSTKTSSKLWLVPLIMLSLITKIKLKQMAYEAMFATTSDSCIYPEVSLRSTNSKKKKKSGTLNFLSYAI